MSSKHDPQEGARTDGKSNAVGWTVHLLISMGIGIVFSLLLEKKLKSYSAGIGYGMAYGIFWWVLGALTVAIPSKMHK